MDKKFWNKVEFLCKKYVRIIGDNSLETCDLQSEAWLKIQEIENSKGDYLKSHKDSNKYLLGSVENMFLNMAEATRSRKEREKSYFNKYAK